MSFDPSTVEMLPYHLTEEQQEIFKLAYRRSTLIAAELVPDLMAAGLSHIQAVNEAIRCQVAGAAVCAVHAASLFGRAPNEERFVKECRTVLGRAFDVMNGEVADER